MESSINKQFIYFTAGWCGVCNKLKPLMTRLSSEFPIKFIDVEKDGEVADIFGVEYIPYLALVKDNKVVDNIEGEFNEQNLRELWNQA
jgi:thioredoxin-like negative regulator of GroEL